MRLQPVISYLNRGTIKMNRPGGFSMMIMVVGKRRYDCIVLRDRMLTGRFCFSSKTPYQLYKQYAYRKNDPHPANLTQ
jgi:hypothetical protein